MEAPNASYWIVARRNEIAQILERCNLIYVQVGLVVGAAGVLSRSRQDIIHAQHLRPVVAEFTRVFQNLSVRSAETVSAA